MRVSFEACRAHTRGFQVPIFLLGLFCASIALSAFGDPCGDGFIEFPIGNVSYTSDSVQVVPRDPHGVLMSDMYFGIRLLGVVELAKNPNGSCAYDPTTSQWTTNYVRRQYVADDLTCDRQINQGLLPNGIHQFQVHNRYRSIAYPDFELSIKISVVDGDFDLPIVPGYNGSYRSDRVKFDADITNWPWARGDTSLALYSLVYFPAEFPDSRIEAYSGGNSRYMQYSRVGAAIPLNLTLSAETDFAADGVHYRSASDEIYEIRDNLLAHHFGVGFCDGNVQRQFNNITWDPTLSYLFGEPTATPQETPSPIKKNSRPVWIPVVSTILVVGFLGGLAVASYFIVKRSPTRDSKRNALTRATDGNRTLPQAAPTTAPTIETTTPTGSAWAAASKPPTV